MTKREIDAWIAFALALAAACDSLNLRVEKRNMLQALSALPDPE